LVYDVGPRYRSGFDSGAEIVVPAARSLGIAAVDVVVVSHADNDHAGGLDGVLAVYPDAVVLAGPDVERSDIARCRQGQHWRWDGVDFELLHPPTGLGARGNDSSCVLRVRAGGTALIMLGDLERYGERMLVAAGDDLSADVAVVPHHGSATSSSAALVSAIGARYAIVSAAYANRWGFPKPEIAARWQSAGSSMLVTGDVGAVGIAVDADGALSVAAQRRRWRRPWHLANGDAQAVFPGAIRAGAL
jgi:competence protein ComEC